MNNMSFSMKNIENYNDTLVELLKNLNASVLLLKQGSKTEQDNLDEKKGKEEKDQKGDKDNKNN